MPQLPSKKDYDEIVKRLKAAQNLLMPKVQELRDVADWQRWANVGIQEQLCEKMEALKSVADPEVIAEQVRELQQQWRQAADVPRAQGEALWKRFKTAHDEAWTRCEAHFAAQAEARGEQPGEKGRALRTRRGVGRFDELDSDCRRDQEAAGRVEDDRRSEPRTGKGDLGAVSQRLRSVLHPASRRPRRAKGVWADNLAKKEALCAKAEALKDSTDWDAAAQEMKRLQAEWKTIGPVKKSRSEALWQRFRGAGRSFLRPLRPAPRHRARRTRRRARGDLSGAGSARVVRRLKTSPLRRRNPAEAPADLMAGFGAFAARWQAEIAARGVDRDRAVGARRALRAGVRGRVARWPVGLWRNRSRSRREPQEDGDDRRRIEALAKSLGGPAAAAADAALSPTTRLAAMLKEALAANTIGGKADDDSRLRAAGDEVRQAQATLSRIGPVPDQVRRALADRFQRATRRIADVTQQEAAPQPRVTGRS